MTHATSSVGGWVCGWVGDWTALSLLLSDLVGTYRGNGTRVGDQGIVPGDGGWEEGRGHAHQRPYQHGEAQRG